MKNIKYKKIINEIILFFLCLIIVIAYSGISNDNLFIDINAEEARFSVREINPDGTFSDIISSHILLEDAKNQMNLSGNWIVTMQVQDINEEWKFHTKIVAQPKNGFAQSFPFRQGNASSAAQNAPDATLKIFKEKSLTNIAGYVESYNQIFVYDVSEESNGIIADIEISGQRGFVDIYKIDLIPLFYMNKDSKIILGGNISYPNQSPNAYARSLKAETYTVNANNEITFNQFRTNSKSSNASLTYGITPSWLGEGTYYSNDGIRFFRDIERQIPVLNGSEQGQFYSYFQWLPVNTISLHTGDSFSELLKSYNFMNSIYYNETQAFIENANKYGMNALLLFAQGSLESGYGTSGFAVNRFNLFGWGAADSNPGGASYFDSVSDSINMQMSKNLRDYTNPSVWKHFGFGFGNVQSGIANKYASDPYYGVKVAALAYTIDKNNGFKDYNNYQLMKINEGTVQSFYNEPNSNKKLYGNKNHPNQIIASLGIVGDYTKTHSVIPKNGGRSPLNLLEEYAYIPTSGLSALNAGGPIASPLPTSLVILDDKLIEYTLISNLELRTEWNLSSRVLITIPKDTTLYGKLSNNGFVQLEYGGFKGYVSIASLIQGETPPVGSKSGIYQVKSDPHATLSLRETPSTSANKLAAIPNGTSLKITDDGNMPWMLTSFNNTKGYVHYDFLQFLNVDDTPTYKKGDVNADNLVDMGDAMSIANYVIKYSTLSDEQYKRAQLETNDEVSMVQAMRIANYYLGNGNLD